MKIKELTLWSGKLNETKSYFRDKLELPVIQESETEFTVQIGATAVTFKTAEGKEQPYYHLAFNIPENQFAEAKAWAKERLVLNQHEGKDETFFDYWNAHAFYFEDPSGNLLECIARHDMSNASTEPFTSASLLEVSEIGMPTDQVLAVVQQLDDLGVPNYQEVKEAFTPVGDEHGLGIVVKQGRQWFFSEMEAKSYPFEMVVDGIGKVIWNEDHHLVKS